jgi:hypothetical protein
MDPLDSVWYAATRNKSPMATDSQDIQTAKAKPLALTGTLAREMGSGFIA